MKTKNQSIKAPYSPPFNITERIIELIAETNERIGAIGSINRNGVNPLLRRKNQIKTIHSSLAIENNSLSLEQVTDIVNGKHVLGTPNEIKEVKNAIKAYNVFSALNPYSMEDILKAHAILMDGLVKDAGCLRSGGVGVFTGKELIHMAPPAKIVPALMRDLINWTKTSKMHPLIKSCVFHYEFEFIHPFSDGNGRMGRMWQTLLLSKWKQFLTWLPVETIIRERQVKYYRALAASDRAADSTVFVEFMLNAILDALDGFIQTEQVREQVTEQVEHLVKALGQKTLSAKDLMKKLGLKHRQSFSNLYLRPALKFGLIEMTVPDKPNSSKQKYRRI